MTDAKSMHRNAVSSSRRIPSMSGGAGFVLSACLWTAAWGMLLAWWFAHDPAPHLAQRLPGMCGEPAASSSESPGEVRIGEFFTSFQHTAAGIIPGRWPRFRGPRFDNISTDPTPLRHQLGDTPRILWSVELGEGHAAPAVADGRVFVLDYDEQEEADALRCFSLADGTELWRRWYTVKVKRNHGMSRTIPAVSDSFVVTVGPRCHVMCVRPDSGQLLWGIDLVEEYGTEVPLWYTGQCPLIDDSVAVIAPGGTALMIGVDCRSGEVVWETPNPRGWKMSHSSIMPARLGGRRVYLYCAVGGIAGVAADGPDRGAVLFETDAFNKSVIAPSPVVLDNDRIYMTAGYGAGSMLFRVTSESDSFAIIPLDTIGVKEGPSSEQQTPLYYREHLFMVLPKDAGALRGQFVCMHPDSPGEVLWSSGPHRRFGLGPYLLADGKVYLLDDQGTLTIARASTAGFDELSSVKIMDAVDAWGPMALVAGRLLVRDATRMVCVDIAKQRIHP